MSASQAIEISKREERRWDIAPNSARVADLDASVRARLRASLDYIGELVARRTGLPLPKTDELHARLGAGQVSPWLFCLYSRLVADLSKNADAAALESYDGMVEAAALPAEGGVIAYRDSSISAVWWDHLHRLLDTDRQRPFEPAPPEAEVFAVCQGDVRAALALMQRADPTYHDELRSLLRTIVLAAPGPEEKDRFNGASTFFFWGGSLINAGIRRSAIAMIDLLVHESSHVLLFGIAAEDPLTRNPGTERYASPLRRDARPIDGIFHACFVTTRVHLAMSRLLASGSLRRDEADEATSRLEYNGNAARTSLELLDLHAEPTELGKHILGDMAEYWRNG